MSCRSTKWLLMYRAIKSQVLSLELQKYRCSCRQTASTPARRSLPSAVQRRRDQGLRPSSREILCARASPDVHEWSSFDTQDSPPTSALDDVVLCRRSCRFESPGVEEFVRQGRDTRRRVGLTESHCRGIHTDFIIGRAFIMRQSFHPAGWWKIILGGLAGAALVSGSPWVSRGSQQAAQGSTRREVLAVRVRRGRPARGREPDHAREGRRRGTPREQRTDLPAWDGSTNTACRFRANGTSA